MKEDRYYKLNAYLQNKIGERTLKICINGHFTCPNRDGTLGKNGCIFCSEKGSGEHLSPTLDIQTQVQEYLASSRSQRANKFIVYFQNFSNTYDTIENLKSKYDASLIDDRIIGISIATRPDCITKEVVDLLKTYLPRYMVWVELGLQTANENIGKLIHRNYTNQQFTNAVYLLNDAGIDVIAHLMIGLPNETEKDIKDTVSFINAHSIKGLKIHSTYVVKNTALEKMYQSQKYTPITLEYYLENLAYVMTHISRNIVIHRISGDAPKDLLVAPEWNLHKKWILNGFDKLMREQDLWQGCYRTNT